MPGDDLLFQRLSVSTIGAVWFHGRVRDGIGWVTDAMATKQWSQRKSGFLIDATLIRRRHPAVSSVNNSKAVIDGGILQARTELLGPVSSIRYRTSTPGLST